ncbi:hypothetical protein K7X08_005132 [Anisodus acutangulus]|uniref:Uncharacterized protein n=1 Tax=Anisodus acutangulus TaxID=402998 RepID=A0A9Q1MHW8_9SOLA|nr:hypothetical protein K7X08_005132 [Anisodus acutangulus]
MAIINGDLQDGSLSVSGGPIASLESFVGQVDGTDSPGSADEMMTQEVDIKPEEDMFEASRLLDGNVPGNAVCSSGAAKSSSLFDLSLLPSHELQQIGVGPGANTLTTTDDNPEINLKRRVKTVGN